MALGVLLAHSLMATGGAAQPLNLTVSPSNFSMNEGATATYTVVLDSAPSADATVALTVTDDTSRCGDGHGASCTQKSGVITINKTSLTFTTTDWSTAQTITVTATDEDMAGVFKFGKITHQINDQTNRPVVSVTVLDDDRRGVTHYQKANDGTVGTKFAAVSLYENHGEGGFYIHLDSEPSATTTITPASAQPAALTVPSQTLTFTSENWDDAQLVRFTLIDNFIDGENNQIKITLTTGGTGSDYVGQSLVPFTVNVVDDDTRGVTHYLVA